MQADLNDACSSLLRQSLLTESMHSLLMSDNLPHEVSFPAIQPLTIEGSESPRSGLSLV